MDNWASGFRHRRGASIPGARCSMRRRRAACSRAMPASSLPCRSAYGFATVYAEPAAARPDRPVTTVTYELADTGTAPRYLFAELVKRLGQPDEVTRDDSPEAANENTVVLHANWHRDKVEDRPVALRRADDRRNSAMRRAALYLSWADQDAAAAPFLPAWIAANAAAASAAEGARLRVFSVRYDDLRRRLPTALARRAGAAVAGRAPDAGGDRRTPRQDDFRPVDRRRRFALVPLDRPHHRAAGRRGDIRAALLRRRAGARRRLHGNRHGILVGSRRPRFEPR